MTMARAVVLKHRTAAVHYSKISATGSYHSPRVTAQLATLLLLFCHMSFIHNLQLTQTDLLLQLLQ
jgi:hypothetical protein